MEEERAISITPQFKYVPVELIHRIQSLLPEKDVAHTCVLSKSWLHAWSTIPTLRFTTCVTNDHLTKQEHIDYIQLIDRTLLRYLAMTFTKQEHIDPFAFTVFLYLTHLIVGNQNWHIQSLITIDYIQLIDRTLLRYLNDNMTIECLRLHLEIEILSLPSPVENWFQVLASGNCLKELFLTICGKKLNNNEVGWLTIPDAIFSCENLKTLSVRADRIEYYEVSININPVIKCSYLIELNLKDVCISDATLHNLFSSCRLLEKIVILWSQHLKNIKVKNLRYLRYLKIKSKGDYIDSLEIYDVPSLRLISYENYARPFTMRMDTLRSVRELYLCSMTVDDTFSKIIVSKFPFLETLFLLMPDCTLETLKITCDSLKSVTLNYCLSNKQKNIKIYASKLLYFSYKGLKMPSLSFPSSTPAHIELILSLRLSHPIDLSCFLRVREALDLSSSFDIEILNNSVSLNVDLDDVRRMIPFPARNVQHLSFGKDLDKKLWRHSPLLDFLFSICYPCYVNAFYRSSNCKNYWSEKLVEMMEKKTCDLKDIEIKNPGDGKWESLTNSWRSSHSFFELPRRSFIDDEGDDYNSDEFKLNWW